MPPLPQNASSERRHSPVGMVGARLRHRHQYVRRERPRGRARGQICAPRAGSLTPLPHCDTGNRAVTGRHKAPPASCGGHRPKALLLLQLETAYQRSVIRVEDGSTVTLARREGANRAFGQRSPFSAPLHDERTEGRSHAERAHPPDAHPSRPTPRRRWPPRGVRGTVAPSGCRSPPPSRARGDDGRPRR